MKRTFGLIGYPLTHSFSRKFFTEKFANEHLDAEYLNFEIPSITDLPGLIVANPDLEGFNITIPYKEQIIPYLDEISDAAKEIKAVNTVKIVRNGTSYSLHGFNTDIHGFQESIRPILQKQHKKALVLGTGGASKAIVKALKNLGIETQLVSRSPKSTSEISYTSLDKEILSRYDIIVNTSPIGTYPKVEEKPEIPYSYITSDHLLFDLVYNPEVTAFLMQGIDRGSTTKNGLEMLHLQALAAWDIWNK
jgi:shikimate dehydrogenase